jgi:hypothetical protein
VTDNATVKQELESYFKSIKSELKNKASVDVTFSDFYINGDEQAFIIFEVSSKRNAPIKEIENVLLKYDLILDGSDDPNKVDFDFNPSATSPDSYAILKTNQIFATTDENDPFFGASAEGYTLQLPLVLSPMGLTTLQRALPPTILP